MTTFVVTTSADVANGDVSPDDLSLREAIELANASSGADRITFADGIDYVALTDELPTISDGLRLVGGGNVVLDANADGDLDPGTTAEEGSRRGLTMEGDGVAVTVDGLTITGGSTESGGGGGGIWSGGGVDLKIVGCEIVRNTAGYDYGGGIRAFGNLTLVRSSIEGNIGFAGGGVFAQGTTRVSHSTIKGNESGSGGGIYSVGPLSLWHSVIVANQAVHTYGGNGGGIWAAGDVSLVASRVLRNVASGEYPEGGLGYTLVL
jgi:hypothetical protein